MTAAAERSTVGEESSVWVWLLLLLVATAGTVAGVGVEAAVAGAAGLTPADLVVQRQLWAGMPRGTYGTLDGVAVVE